jgi:hypothetical protein
VSVLTGIAPRELLALDGAMFDAVLLATVRHYGQRDGEPSPELAAEPERVNVIRLAEIGGMGVERVGVSK